MKRGSTSYKLSLKVSVECVVEQDLPKNLEPGGKGCWLHYEVFEEARVSATQGA